MRGLLNINQAGRALHVSICLLLLILHQAMLQKHITECGFNFKMFTLFLLLKTLIFVHETLLADYLMRDKLNQFQYLK